MCPFIVTEAVVIPTFKTCGIYIYIKMQTYSPLTSMAKPEQKNIKISKMSPILRPRFPNIPHEWSVEYISIFTGVVIFVSINLGAAGTR